MLLAQVDWHSLYTSSVEDVWKVERPELRKMAMLLHILGLELEKVRNSAEKEMNKYRQSYAVLDKHHSKRAKSSQPRAKLPLQGQLRVTAITPLAPLTEDPKKSYISPDIFQCGSPDFSTHLDDSRSNESIVNDSIVIPHQTSPKISRNKRHLRLKKRKVDFEAPVCNTNLANAPSDFKRPVPVPLPKDEKTPKRGLDEIIVATPEQYARKPKLISQRKHKFEKSKTKLFTNTLTQMFAQPTQTTKHCNDSDIDQTYIDQPSEEVLQLDEIMDMINEDDTKENVRFKQFKKFALDYDKVPEKGVKPLNNSNKEDKCRSCDRLGVKCSKHSTSPVICNKTFTGFWDVDFTVKDPHMDSEESTIF